MSDRGPSLRTGCQAVTDASRRRRLRPTPPKWSAAAAAQADTPSDRPFPRTLRHR